MPFNNQNFLIAIIIVLALIVLYSASKQCSKQGYAFLPSDYGLSSMNRGVGFVKPFSINVNVPQSESSFQGINALEQDSSQRVKSQINLASNDQISEAELEKIRNSVQPQVEQQTQELKELLEWRGDFMGKLHPNLLLDLESLCPAIPTKFFADFYGITQDNIDMLKLLKANLKDVSPLQIKNRDDLIKYIVPSCVNHRNQQLESAYPGMYEYSWINVV